MITVHLLPFPTNPLEIQSALITLSLRDNSSNQTVLHAFRLSSTIQCVRHTVRPLQLYADKESYTGDLFAADSKDLSPFTSTQQTPEKDNMVS